MKPISGFPNYKIHIMKNTTSQETGYPVPTLRVAFRKEVMREVKGKRAGKSKKQVEEAVQPKVDLPLFDDYRRKARDHDPL
jgi:hypothetical protein